MAMIIFGAGGGLGQALVSHFAAQNQYGQVFAVSRQAQPQDWQAPAETGGAEVRWLQVEGYTAEHIAPLLKGLQEQAGADPSFVLRGVLSTLGVLHTDAYMPEKKLADLNAAQLQDNFNVNAILPLLLMQQTLPLFDKKQPGFWVQLSAMVSSITDNQLGGWYSYRASKAALNMLMKTAAIELQRSHKRLTLAAIHPGTTDTELSKPFQERIRDGKLYSPMQSAQRIAKVIDTLTPAQSGKLWHWNGEVLPY